MKRTAKPKRYLIQSHIRSRKIPQTPMFLDSFDGEDYRWTPYRKGAWSWANQAELRVRLALVQKQTPTAVIVER